jgi:hypothetical protein
MCWQKFCMLTDPARLLGLLNRLHVSPDCRRYIDDEIQARGIDSPFRVNGAIMGLFNALLTLKEEGKPITKMIASVELLAQANSRRGALASALLPPLHWVMLGSLTMLLLSAFLLFDSDFTTPVAENRTIFAVLSAMLVSILQVCSRTSRDRQTIVYCMLPLTTSLQDCLRVRFICLHPKDTSLLYDPGSIMCHCLRCTVLSAHACTHWA